MSWTRLQSRPLKMPTTAEGRLARPQALPLFTRQRRFCAVQALGCHRRFYYSTLSTNRSSRFAWPRAVEELSLALDDLETRCGVPTGVFRRDRTLRPFRGRSITRLQRGRRGHPAPRIRTGAAGGHRFPHCRAQLRKSAFTPDHSAELQKSGSLGATTGSTSVGSALERLLNEAIGSSSDPAKLSELLEELALAGGRDQIATLASKSRITEEEVRRLLDTPQARVLLVRDRSTGMAALFHTLIRDFILSQLILVRRFRLADLKFGAEEAEKGRAAGREFVPRQSLEAILDQRRSIVVGDRGAGKSAIFRKLATSTSAVEGHQRVEIFPVANTGDLLHRIVDEDAWLDADALRAAWLVVVASLVASTVPESAPKKLRRDAAELRSAFGFLTEPGSLARRALRAAVRPLVGTTLKFAVGPVNLEAKLPAGSGGRPSKATVDVESFLQEVDSLLRESARRVVVMFDRIDETFKYNRAKQEAVVQALLQAESHISLFERIGLVVFVRTDLFELYDIQEKSKLVSRTLALDWSDEDWLQVLVRRVLANDPLERLAERVHVADGSIDTRTALEVLFPPEIEGQPVDRWLIDSLRNGNGDVSPRLAVLLLHLTRELSARPEDVVSMLPLFSADAVREAMTKLSDLSFSEVVNDFKVAPSFVLNCRAGKLDSFALHEVKKLFDGAEER